MFLEAVIRLGEAWGLLRAKAGTRIYPTGRRFSSWNIASDQGKRAGRLVNRRRARPASRPIRTLPDDGSEPDVHRSVRTPRPPGFGVTCGIVSEHAPQPQIGGGERVPLAARAH